MANYDKSKHIIENVSNTTVKLGISIIHLDVDEKNRVLVTDVWTRLRWTDKDLVWKKENFGNVSNIKVNYDVNEMFTLYGKVNNVTDRLYAERAQLEFGEDYTPAAPRQVFVGLEVKL